MAKSDEIKNKTFLLLLIRACQLKYFHESKHTNVIR